MTLEWGEKKRKIKRGREGGRNGWMDGWMDGWIVGGGMVGGGMVGGRRGGRERRAPWGEEGRKKEDTVGINKTCLYSDYSHTIVC